MSDERLDLSENTSTEKTKEVDMGKDWELALEDLNATILEETPKLTDLIRQHYMDLGKRDIEIREQAAASGEEKKLRSKYRQLKASYRKDIEIGRKLIEWEQALDRPEDTEAALQTIFSEVGLGVGFGLLGKLPDTYSKPNVRATDTERRRQVAIAILDELVGDVTVANETDPKNDLVVARVGNLIKTYTLPEVGDRVEFDKTMRGVAVEIIDEEISSDGNVLSNVMDAVIVRLDNSGEEKKLLRGEKKFTGEPIARLHEAAIVRGDHQALYGHTVVIQNHEPGNSELVEVLCLDGTSEKIPTKDLVRAKPKDAKVVGDLLHLVSEKGHLDKIKLAVEHAEKPLLQEIDKLRATAEANYTDGQIFAASNLSEVQPEVFVGAFTAMPSEKQAIVLSQIVPKPPLPPLDVERAIEIQAEDVVDFLTHVTPEPIPEPPIVTKEVASDPTPESPEPEREPELDGELIKKAEEILKTAFDTYRTNHERAQARKNNEPLPESPIATFQGAINNPEVKTFLTHSVGRHFLAVIASEAWGAVGSYIKGHWSDLNTEVICDRLQLASTEVYEAAELYRAGNKEAIKPLDSRLKVAAQYGCLSKEERLAIGKNGKVATENAVKPKKVAKTTPKVEKQIQGVETTPIEIKLPDVGQPNVELIRTNLLTSNHCDNAFNQMRDYGLSLSDVISCEALQEFCNKGDAQSRHVEVILEALDEPNYLTF
jgi:hypothetical protein